MSNNLQTIINQLQTLTLLETTELVAEMEKVFQIDVTSAKTASANFVMPAEAQTEQKTEAVEEKTSFDIILEQINESNRLNTLKIIRKLTSFGLAEVKQLITELPKTLKEGLSKEEAEQIQNQLKEVGAKVTLK